MKYGEYQLSYDKRIALSPACHTLDNRKWIWPTIPVIVWDLVVFTYTDQMSEEVPSNLSDAGAVDWTIVGVSWQKKIKQLSGANHRARIMTRIFYALVGISKSMR
jgi:uncharacterized membrane protein YuzA (DUF378 family)